MDNASIQHDNSVRYIIGDSNCFLIYNAPYSAEANPIERIFGIWKLRSEQELMECSSFVNFLSVISRHFYSLGNREISNTITSVQSTIWQRIYDRYDLYLFCL